MENGKKRVQYALSHVFHSEGKLCGYGMDRLFQVPILGEGFYKEWYEDGAKKNVCFWERGTPAKIKTFSPEGVLLGERIVDFEQLVGSKTSI
jgi:hypothetical protein